MLIMIIPIMVVLCILGLVLAAACGVMMVLDLKFNIAPSVGALVFCFFGSIISSLTALALACICKLGGC